MLGRGIPWSADGDVVDLPFGAGTFHLVVSLSVIEWVSDYEKAIAEVARVIRPGGQWIVSLPNWGSPFRRIEGTVNSMLRRGYTRLQKNRLRIDDFRAIGMMCVLSLTKRKDPVTPARSSSLYA
jgi:ubiquinone/menaquinone biosynthesis C-methylase UbiE